MRTIARKKCELSLNPAPNDNQNPKHLEFWSWVKVTENHHRIECSGSFWK